MFLFATYPLQFTDSGGGGGVHKDVDDIVFFIIITFRPYLLCKSNKAEYRKNRVLEINPISYLNQKFLSRNLPPGVDGIITHVLNLVTR